MVKSSGSALAQISLEILKSNGHYLPSDLATPGFHPSLCRNTAKCLTRLLITIFFFLLCNHNYRVVWICLCCHNPPNSDMDYRIFNMRTDVNACNRTRGCTDTERESALRVDSGKIPCRTGESNLRQRHVGPMLFQLSYIPSRLSAKTSMTVKLCKVNRFCCTYS